MLRQLLNLIHFSGVIVWVGGMFFAYFCLRPAAAGVLDPPKRLTLWVASFELFFRYTSVAVALILVSGLAMIFQSGFRAAPIGWHIMLTLGLLMSLVFCNVYLILYPRLRHHCEASAWPAAAATLNTIRRLVAINLSLSVCTVAAAVFAR
jgi:uncharacterized membrane protein